MGITSTFNTFLKIALETSRGNVPDRTTNPMWFSGGKWFDVTPEGLPSLQNQQAIIFAAGTAGKRTRNNRAPVLGRHWSDGGFSFPVTEDFMGALLYATLGSGSANSVAPSSLMNEEPAPGGAAKSFVLASQPTGGGNILEFYVSGASAGGLLSVSGIDAYGNGASETLSFASAGSFYTRTSFSSIGASGIQISGNHGGASLSVRGVQYWEYIFSVNATSGVTMSIEDGGNPMSGATSKAFLRSGMVVQEFTLNTPADQRDGLFTGNVSFEGNPGSEVTATSLNSVSAISVWPAWGLNITRDGVNWHQVTNAALTVAAGGRNYRAAAGTRSPQGSFFGALEVTGAMDILVVDEAEYNRWLGASRHSLHLNWDTPHKLTTTKNQALSASLTSAYLENITQGESDDALTLSADIRTIDDATDSVIRFKLTCGVPPQAYNLA